MKIYSYVLVNITYVSGMQNIPKRNTPYPILEKIQNVAGRPMVASIVGLNFPDKKKDVTAIDVANPEPISLAFEGSNSDWNIQMHELYAAPSPNNAKTYLFFL